MDPMEQKCRCLELEERVSKAQEKYTALESEMKKGKEEFASLEFRFKELESEKLVMEEEFRKLKEESENDSLMVNKALEIEKQVAEKEAEGWKRRFEKLVGRFYAFSRCGELELDEDLKLGFELAGIEIDDCNDAWSREELAFHRSLGSPCVNTPAKENITGRRGDNVSRMLVFDGDGSKSTNVVDISDETEQRSEKGCDSRERSVCEEYEDEDVEDSEVNASNLVPSRKRKLVITSDSEDDDEDSIPISILKKLKPPNQETPDLVNAPAIEENGSGRPRRVSSRLKKQRVSEEITASSEQHSKQRLVGIPTTGDAKDDDTDEESEGESEGESLDGFIVDDDDSHETVSEKSDEIREEESDGEAGYADVMSRLRRDKKPKKKKWEYEADMLADFGKDPELCMRAVCVLYRFQTEDEKFTSSSHISNGRGFNKFDAVRGTRIGKFLTDGDPEGDLKKSVEELKSFEFDAVETCRSLADRYSKQLFQIYNNREDPFFTLPPSP